VFLRRGRGIGRRRIGFGYVVVFVVGIDFGGLVGMAMCR
jgi:hypothetical protein